MEQPKENRRAVRFFGILALAILAFWGMSFIYSKVAVTTSESLPYRIFILTEPKPAKDSYVIFYHKDRYIDARVIKRVACVAGERIEARGRDYYCEGLYLGRAKETDRKGQKLDNFIYNGVIPDGKMFVLGDHSGSYDSRYWGFLSENEVMASATPIF